MITGSKGFTLIEISVSIVVGFVIVTMITAMFLFIWNHTIQWQSAVKACNKLHVMTKTLNRDLLLSQSVRLPDENTLHLETVYGVVVYHSESGRLWRNGQAMNGEILTLKSVDFIPVYILPEDCVPITTAQIWTEQLQGLQIHFTFLRENKPVHGKAAVDFRIPVGWHPLPQ